MKQRSRTNKTRLNVDDVSDFDVIKDGVKYEVGMNREWLTTRMYVLKYGLKEQRMYSMMTNTLEDCDRAYLHSAKLILLKNKSPEEYYGYSGERRGRWPKAKGKEERIAQKRGRKPKDPVLKEPKVLKKRGRKPKKSTEVVDS